MKTLMDLAKEIDRLNKEGGSDEEIIALCKEGKTRMEKGERI